MPDEITAEFANADLGDPRRAKRLPKLAAALAEAPAESISAASGGWSEVMAAYRFLNNGEFEAGELIRPHRRMIVERSVGKDCVLAIQDTTELDFTPMKTVTDLGPLNDETRRGFYMHGHYVVSEQGLPLGVLGADIILRDDENSRQAANRKNLPIEEKESHRWIEGYRKACELARDLPDTEVISVSDREGDIFELYLEWLNSEGSPRAEWVVRANQDRVLVDVEKGVPAQLFEAMRTAPLLGEIQFDVAAKTGSKKVKGNRVKTQRKARTVRQQIRAMEITSAPAPAQGPEAAEGYLLGGPGGGDRSATGRGARPLAVAHQQKDHDLGGSATDHPGLPASLGYRSVFQDTQDRMPGGASPAQDL